MVPSRGRGLDLTAHFTAQAWLRGGFRYAHWFDTWEGRMLWDMGRLARLGGGLFLPPMMRYQADYLILRHRVVEQRLLELAPDVVVEFGAGLSSRGIAVAERYPDVRYIELDLAPVVAAKRTHMRGHRLPENYHLQRGNLLHAPLAGQVPAVAAHDRVLVVTEGLLPYLSLDQKRTAWSNVVSFLHGRPGAAYLFDEYPRERFRGQPQAALMVHGVSALAGLAVQSNLFDTEAALMSLLSNSGFDRIECIPALDRAATGRPWPPPEHCPWLLIEARPDSGAERHDPYGVAT